MVGERHQKDFSRRRELMSSESFKRLLVVKVKTERPIVWQEDTD